MDKLYQIFKTGLSLDAGGVAGYASATSFWPFHKAPNNLTDLEKMKKSLDGLDIDCHVRDYSDGFLWLDIYGESAHVGVEIKFHKDGSRFRANEND